MSDEIKKTPEDLYADTDFDENDEMQDAQFICAKVESVKVEENGKEKYAKYFNKDKKLLGEKIIEKKSGEITEIKYNILGQKETVRIRYKDKKIKKCTDYYENGSLKLVTDYAPDGTYRSVAYHVDGSRQSYVEKHIDGTADAVYFDIDKAGGKLLVKLDKNKQPIEKHVEH